MEKRSKTRTKKLGRKTNRPFFSDDRISLLPDEILVMILSRLKIHQSIQTSILSRRWKTLWTFTTTIDFDCSSIPLNSNTPGRFVHCLNRALGSHRGPTLNRLRIRLTNFASSDVPFWIDFAIKKSVQELALELETKSAYFRAPGFSRFDSLKALSLFYANVTDNHVEYFCSHCPNLETLSLVELGRVENLSIRSKSLVSLELSRCFLLRRLRISAESLVSFKYWGRDREIDIEHAPLLSEVSFCEAYCTSLVEHKFKHFTCVLSQLQTLKLTMSYPWITVFPKLDGLINLSNLDLEFKVWGWDPALNLCTSVIKALPCLHKLSLHLFRSDHEDYSNHNEKDEYVEGERHHCLRVVEFLGFTGCWLDIQIIQFVIENAVSLEKMTVVPSRRAWIDSDGDVMEFEEKEEARKRARLLENQLSPYTRLFVL